MILRILFFYLLGAAFVYVLCAIIMRYVSSILHAGKRKENNTYKKWNKFWRKL